MFSLGDKLILLSNDNVVYELNDKDFKETNYSSINDYLVSDQENLFNSERLLRLRYEFGTLLSRRLIVGSKTKCYSTLFIFKWNYVINHWKIFLVI